MKFNFLFALQMCFLLFFCYACDNNSDSETMTLTVASKKIKVNDPASQIELEYLCVRYPNNETWRPFYGYIEGFNYEKGYEYIINIGIEEIQHPQQDGLSARYYLIKIISKEKKDSEGTIE